jgi:hypothetical protein
MDNHRDPEALLRQIEAAGDRGAEENSEPLPDDRLACLRESGDTVKSFLTA